MAQKAPLTYCVTYNDALTGLNGFADWEHPVWSNIPALELAGFMGTRPEHFPRTSAKLAYDGEALFVCFHVFDQFVRATADRHQDAVCVDSCVEFFFTPSTDVSLGYFNLELNCGGTMLFHFQREPRLNSHPIAGVQEIAVHHSLPKLVEPQIDVPTEWTVSYRMPFSVLKPHFPSFEIPLPGTIWRANFYKCADESTHPHWLTWSPVDFAIPDFHRPGDFGVLQFA